MDKQPFLVVTKTNGEQIIINENHVVFIEKIVTDARITFSTGDYFVIVDPPYEAWEADCLIRKD